MLNFIFSLFIPYRLKRFKYRHKKYTQYKNHRQNIQHSAYTTQALSYEDIKNQINDLPSALVVWVIDGDTVIVKHNWQEIKIRLDSIDCPEDGQYWGDIAAAGLIKMIGGKYVQIEEHGIDYHGRTLATLWIWNNQKKEWMNVNERMVTLGHAWVMRRFYNHLPIDRREKYNQLERWAKSKSVGLWNNENPIPPWEWRKN
jgi:endonuclease YncB( thermonuclease family)